MFEKALCNRVSSHAIAALGFERELTPCIEAEDAIKVAVLLF